MKRGISILAIFLGVVFYGPVYAGIKPGADLDNFRGIKWGTDFSQFPKDEFTEEKSQRPEEKAFSKQNENLDVLGVKAESIQYIFYDNRFIGVNIKFNFDRQDELRDSLTEFLGKPDEFDRKERDLMVNFTWKGDKMLVSEAVNFEHRYIILFVYSKIELEKMSKDKRDVLKDKVKKGF